jgi:predicted RNase H-like HicB family nuclease
MESLTAIGATESRVKQSIFKPEAVAEYHFTVFFEPLEEGGYVDTCPALPGLITEGDSLPEARLMVRDAIRAYIESLRKDGERVPADVKLSLPRSTRRRRWL